MTTKRILLPPVDESGQPPTDAAWATPDWTPEQGQLAQLLPRTAEQAQAVATSPAKKSLLRRVGTALTNRDETDQASIGPKWLKLIPFVSPVIRQMEGEQQQRQVIQARMEQERVQTEQERVQTAILKAPKVMMRGREVLEVDPVSGTVKQVKFASDDEAVAYLNKMLQGITDPTDRAAGASAAAYHISQNDPDSAAKVITSMYEKQSARMASARPAEYINDVESSTGYSHLYRNGYGDIVRAERNILPPPGYLPTTSTRQQLLQVPQADGSIGYKLIDATATSQKTVPGRGAKPTKAPVLTGGATVGPIPATTPGVHDLGITGGKPPTGQAANRAKAAEAIMPLIEDANRMLSDPAIRAKLGVLPGRVSEVERVLGNIDPDAAELYGTLKSIYSLAGAMHGWRAIQVAQEFEKAYGGLHTDPNSLLGGLRAMTNTAQRVAAAGGGGRWANQPGRYAVGQTVLLGNGKKLRVTKVYADNSFDGTEVR